MSACAACQQPIEENARFCPFCGAAAAAGAAPPADPFLGRIVNGKFRVDGLLGQGGMGRVYRAHHLTLDRPVVLKMLHPVYSGDAGVVARFQREARAASKLNHPNSIAVLDFGEAEDGTLFMAMEYLAGRDLARLAAEEFPLGAERIVRIGAQILSALAEAHAQGVVHRDLKPENVMVERRRDEPDFVKVLDFGIAMLSAPGAGEPRLTQAGLVCGTPEYMSPEQARGADLDARSDLYSVGVILYQLTTGELPFHSDTPVGFLTRHLTEIPVPPRERRPDLAIPPALDALVARALEKDPARRFQGADEMRAALLACLSAREPAGRTAVVGAPAAAAGQGAPPARTAVVGAPAAAASQAAAPARGGRKGFWILVAVMVVAVGGGGATVLLVKRTAAERNAASLAAYPGPTPTPTPMPIPAPTPADVPLTPSAGPSEPTSTDVPLTPSPPTPTPTPTPALRTSVAPAEPARRRGAIDNRARAGALFEKAEARRAVMDVDGAIRLYLAALDTYPGLAEAEKKLALCYQLKGDTKRAAERYQRYLATDPPDADRVRAVLQTLE